MDIHVDYEKACDVFGRLLHALKSKEFPFESMRLPQDYVPEDIRNDDGTHARFLFYACHYMRGAIKSKMAMQKLASLHGANPHFFVPAHAALLCPEAVSETLGGYINYHAGEIARFWVINSQRLHKHWDSDPRAIFHGVSDADEVRHRIMNKNGNGFLGFQKKMAGMLAYFLMSTKLIEPVRISPPVDFHVLRLLLSHEILVVSSENGNGIRYTQELVSTATSLLERYCAEKGILSVAMCDALWYASSSMCSHAPGNYSKGNKAVPVPVNWSWSSTERRYERACWNCPVRGTCAWNVPAGPYYDTGIFVLSPREHPYLV